MRETHFQTRSGQTEGVQYQRPFSVTWRLAYVVSIASAIFSTRAFWWPGNHVVSYDGATYSGPNTEVSLRAIRDWRIPFLNEFIFGTVPHLGNHAVAVLYPPRLIALIFGSSFGHGLIVVGHVLLIGMGMVALAKRLGVSPLGGAVSGAVVVLVGSTQTKTVQFEQIQPIAWLPVLLLALHVCVAERHRWRSVGALAIVATATLLSGHPQLILEVVIVAVAFTAGLVLKYRTGVLRLVVAAMLAGAMALPQLLATVDAQRTASLDEGRSFDDLGNGMYVLQVRKAAQALFGTVTGGDPAAFSGAFEAIGWFGVVAMMIGVFGIGSSVSNPKSRWWGLSLGAIMLLGVVWSLGPRTPLFSIAYRILPGFDLGRVSVRWLAIVGILLALFVGVGIDAAKNLQSRQVRRAMLVVIAVGLAAIGFGPITAGSRLAGVIWLITALGVLMATIVVNPRHVRQVLGVFVVIELAVLSLSAIPNRITMASAVGASPSPAIGELMSMATDGGYVVALTPDAGPHDELVRGLRPNSNSWFGLRSLDGYDGGVQVTQAWTEMLSAFSETPALDLPLRNSLSAPVPTKQLARFGVRWMVLSNDRSPTEWVPDWRGPVASDDSYTVWENPYWLGDSVAWFATQPPSAEATSALRTDYQQVSETAIADVDLSCSAQCSPHKVELSRLTAEHIVITADVDKPALISAHVQALEGWTATVDGRPSEIAEVDGLYLGVVVPQGSHIIEFRYQPAWWWPSVIVALGGAVISITMISRRRLTS